MINNQMKLNLSSHMSLYDIIIPQDHLLRKIKTMVDFSFIYEELKDNYSEFFGREAVHPVRMFKYLLLKYIYCLSDRGVVERALYDMSFKYFLDLQPEDMVINASSLTKFRKLRLKDSQLLDLLIGKSVELALETGVIKKRTAVIVDSTHTSSRYRQLRKGQMFAKQIGKIEKAVEEMSLDIKMPKKPEDYGHKTEKTRNYGREVVETIKAAPAYSMPEIQEHTELLEEMLDDLADTYDYSTDKEARVGHKTAKKTFYGYKTHLTMTEERIITAAKVTSGEKNDGKELEALLEKNLENGLEVTEVLGDKAYSTIRNIKYLNSKAMKLVAAAHPRMEIGKQLEAKGFEYNKDAGMMQCRQGHLAKRKTTNNRTTDHKNNGVVYYFDVEKCKECPQREGCYKEGQKSKACKVTVKKELYKEQEEFQRSDYFKSRYKERYKIEAKNGELKNRNGYAKSEMLGVNGLEMQGALTIFVVNLKRIIKLEGESLPKNQSIEEIVSE